MRLHQHLQPKHGLERFGPQHLRRTVQRVGPPAFEQQQAITISRGEVQIMQDHQDRDPTIGKLADGLQGDMLMQRVEGRGRLIEQQGLAGRARP